MPARGIGIEIVETLIRAAVVERRRSVDAILGFYEQPIEAGEAPWAERARQSLQELRREARLPRAPVIASVDCTEAHLRTLSMPFRDEEQIARTIKFELEQHLAQYAAEDIVVDFYKVAETDKTTTVLCAALPKVAIAERLRALQAAGLDPEALDLDLYAVCRALHAGGAAPDHGRWLLLHGTERFAKLALVEEDTVRLIRAIRFSIPQAEKKAEEAARRKRWDTKDISGPVPLILLAQPQVAEIDDLAPPTQTSLMAHLAKEIQRFLLAAGTDNPDQIVLSGSFDSARLVGLLSERVRAPVGAGEVLESFANPFDATASPEVARKIPAALGLALRALEPQAPVAPAMDFRQEEFVRTRGLAPHAGALLVMMQLLLVLTCAFGLKMFLNMQDYARLAMFVRDEQAKLAQRVLGEQYRPNEDPAGQIARHHAELIGAATQEAFPLKRSAYETLGEFYIALAELQTKPGIRLGIHKIRVQTDASRGGGNLLVEGTINDPRFLTDLTNALGRRLIFRGVAPPSTRQDPGGGYRFELRHEFREEQ